MQYLALREELIEVGQRCHAQGWVPATSGNFSARIDENQLLITASGRHKGYLSTDDFLIVDLDGRPVDTTHKPSAETLLHCERYKTNPHCQAVLHNHSVTVTALTRHNPPNIQLRDYELLKAFADINSHTSQMTLPVFANSQDMPALAAQVAGRRGLKPFWAYLIAGHGLYTWGSSIMQTWHQLEALEFMLQSELLTRPLPTTGTIK